MARTIRLLAAGILLVAASAGITQGADKDVDREALLKAAQGTVDRVARDGAVWTTAIDMRTGAVITIERLVQGENTRLRISIAMGGRSEMLAEVIARPDAWYVTQNAKRDKYRPYEAVFALPTLYFFISLSDLHVCTQATLAGFLTDTGVGRIESRLPLDAASQEQISGLLRQFKAMVAGNPDKAVSPELQKNMEQLEELSTKGVLHEVETGTGIVRKTVTAKLQAEVRSFRYLTPSDAERFTVDEQRHTDHTQPLAKDMNDVAMFGHMALWQPGQKPGDLDVVLYNLGTGDYRRVPYHGIAGPDGAFSKDRTRAWISGMDVAAGDTGLGLVEIDLKSGTTRPVAGKLSQSGMNLCPRVSRDGKWLSFAHHGTRTAILKGSIVAVNLSTGEEKEVVTGDLGISDWAEGNRIVYEPREDLDINKPEEASRVPKTTICICDLEGHEKELLAATFPVILADGITLLYRDAQQHWMLCDLEGKKQRLLGDGMKNYSFPSAGPDGKRLLMVHYPGEGKAPAPVIVTIDSGAITPLRVPAGFWGLPTW